MCGNAWSGQALVDIHDDFATLAAKDFCHGVGLLISNLASQQCRGVIRRQVGVTQRRDLDLLGIYPQPSL